MPERGVPPATGLDRAVYAATRIFALFISVLPRPVVLKAGSGLGALVFVLDGKHRAIALRNLARALGRSSSPGERRRIARRSFMNFVRSLVDALKTAGWSRERVLAMIEIEGREHLENAHARGRGVLLFTAHFGNWEMVVPPSSAVAPFHVIARALDNPLIERDLLRARVRHGAVVVNKLGAGRPILRALDRGETVGILIDQNVLRREAVFVDFFGVPAATTPALAVFHIRTGAPILPMFCRPAPGAGYRMRFGPPVDVPLSGDETADVLKITGVCTKMIEDEIRKNPALWLWVHKRWRSRPLHER